VKNKILKIAVTGTKGKTTTANLIAQVLQKYDFSRVLLVDTTGHFVNGERRSTLADSKNTWGLVPSVAPGRYLYEFMGREDEEKNVAVMETSLGCSTLSGMGFAMHHVGIFLNIFEDHIGSSKRINSKEDIVEAKKFIISRILRDGFAVLNADDKYVMSVVDDVATHRKVFPIFIGLDLMAANLPNDHQTAAFLTLREGYIVHIYKDIETRIVEVSKLVWTFEGVYEPSVYNALAVCAGIIGLYGGCVPKDLGVRLAETRLGEYGGRLTRFSNENGVEIIADYAHEKKSLVEIARLAHKIKSPNGKVYGILRLAYDRTDELITDTGETIASEFDYVVVYDKIDGHLRQPKKNLQFDRFTQETGKTSQTFYDAVSSKNTNSVRIIREDEAIAHVAKIAQAGDVVVSIVNDDVVQSVTFIKEAFNAQMLEK